MTFTYNTALTSDRDLVRLALGDTDSTNALFTDEEIAGALSLHGSVNGAVVMLADGASAKFSRLADISIDGASFSYGELASRFRAIAQRTTGAGALGTPFVGGVSQSAVNAVREDTDRVPDSFRRGMFDNNG